MRQADVKGRRKVKAGKVTVLCLPSLLATGEGLGMRGCGVGVKASPVLTLRLPARPLFCRRAGARQRGFTLVEAVTVIVVAGILSVTLMNFIRDPVEAYLASTHRAALSDAADTAARRIARELHRALPNSVRVSDDGRLLEFVPVRDAGRYRASAGAVESPGDPLEFHTTDQRFDVLGPRVSAPSGSFLTVYNLGIDGASVYSGEVRRAVQSSDGVSVSFVSNDPLPFASPGSRFQIVGQPVSFACDPDTGELRRHTDYGFKVNQPTSFTPPGELVVNTVSECRFAYNDSTVLQRNGLISLWLKLTREGESVSLQQQINVDNTP